MDLNNNVEIMLGTQNGDGKMHVVWKRDADEYPDSFEPANGYQREQAINRMALHLGVQNPDVKSLDAQLVLLMKEWVAQKNGDGERERFPLVSSPALDGTDYAPTPIITEALFAGIPAIIGAPFKTCKSLVGIDAAISIATGTPWLGSFTVPAPMGVVYFSGEGGPCVAQEYGRRIAASKGLTLADATQLHWCFSVPRIEDVRDLDAFSKVLEDTAAEVAILDNLMLCLSGDNAGNVYSMGSTLGNVIRLCAERNVTPVFVHHFKRVRSTADPFAPGELSDLTQAGAAEIAGQWWLLTRREAYNPEYPGQHHLWLSVGGRVGHSSLHALDVEEGRRTDPSGRRWEVEARAPEDVRAEHEDAKEQAKQAKQSAKRQSEIDSDRREIIQAAVKLRGAETKNGLRDRVGCGHRRFETAFASLVNDGILQSAPVTRTNGQKYEGWKARNEQEI